MDSVILKSLTHTNPELVRRVSNVLNNKKEEISKEEAEYLNIPELDYKLETTNNPTLDFKKWARHETEKYNKMIEILLKNFPQMHTDFFLIAIEYHFMYWIKEMMKRKNYQKEFWQIFRICIENDDLPLTKYFLKRFAKIETEKDDVMYVALSCANTSEQMYEMLWQESQDISISNLLYSIDNHEQHVFFLLFNYMESVLTDDDKKALFFGAVGSNREDIVEFFLSNQICEPDWRIWRLAKRRKRVLQVLKDMCGDPNDENFDEYLSHSEDSDNS